MTQELTDRDLLDIYTRNYNAKRSEGGLREVPAQHAHVAGLRAVAGLIQGAGGEQAEPGTMLTQKGIRVPDEDPGAAHQRRLTSAQFWLNQGERRQRYAQRATFTDIIDAFAAGGLFERSYFEGEAGDFHKVAVELLEATENEVERQLAEYQGLMELLDVLGQMTGTDDPEALVQRVHALVQASEGEPAEEEAAPTEEPPAVEAAENPETIPTATDAEGDGAAATG